MLDIPHTHRSLLYAYDDDLISYSIEYLKENSVRRQALNMQTRPRYIRLNSTNSTKEVVKKLLVQPNYVQQTDKKKKQCHRLEC